MRELYFRLPISLQDPERFARPICPQDHINVVVMRRKFFAVRHQPLAEGLFLSRLFQDQLAVRKFAQSRFDEVFDLRVLKISAQIGDDAGRILYIHG